MKLLEASFVARELSAMREFYTEALGLTLLDKNSSGFSVRAGASQLSFIHAPEISGVYHLAFNIPENQLGAGVRWLRERTELLRSPDESEVFPFESWDAHAAYFTDPDGNILELIARHSLLSSHRESFEILSLSEVGVSVDSVDAEAERLGLPDYRSRSESFRPLGDEEGLLILVKSGRVWWPTESAVAAPLPLTLALSTGTLVYPR
jgi:catechol 2,3-dioxygenase-like lactoylglutathione lyase family enzyme